MEIYIYILPESFRVERHHELHFVYLVLGWKSNYLSAKFKPRRIP
jgi:hypothetical protein